MMGNNYLFVENSYKNIKIKYFFKNEVNLKF